MSLVRLPVPIATLTRLFLLPLATLAALSLSASALPQVVAKFVAQPTSGPPPLTVSFADTSTGTGSSGVTWEWSFGDGSTSTVQNPSHEYAAGTYTVSLTVTVTGGGSDTLIKPQFIVATYPTSESDALFVPQPLLVSGQEKGRVPLSEFKSAPGGSLITLHVDKDIADYPNAVFKMQIWDGTSFLVRSVTKGVADENGVTPLTSVVAVQPGRKCVIVSDSFLQDLPIVTHWRNRDPSVPGDRGGQVVGAQDGLVTLDYVSGQLSATIDPDPPVGNYTYGTANHAIFDDGSGDPNIYNAVVPAYEVYIGENYSTNKITDLAAIWLSDQCRAWTGYPIAHWNYRGSGTSLSSLPKNDLPIFQFIHGYIVDPDGWIFSAGGQPYHATYHSPSDPRFGQPIPGNEQSLASFVLPPGWSAVEPYLNPQGTIKGYPGLFIGDYDLNGSMFTGSWWRLVEPIAMLHRSSPARQVVGILWNGGGAGVAMTHQDSSYYNAAKLILDAQTALKVYADGMVFAGHSRSGGTALQLASNPYDLPYTAKYVNAHAGKTLLGTHLLHFCNPSYPGAMTNMAGATGYKDSWKEGASYDGVSSRDLILRNITGCYTKQEADERSPDSPSLLGGLQREGTRVVFAAGTHDCLMPFEHAATYINHLRAMGIPSQCHVYYRFGHNVPWKGSHVSQHDNDDLLNFVFEELESGSAPLFSDLIQGFRRPSQGENPLSIEGPFVLVDGSHLPQFNEREVPIVFELPLETGYKQKRTWSIVGPPGAHVLVRAQIMGQGWDHDPDTVPTMPGALSSQWNFLLPDLEVGEDPDRVLFKSLTVERPVVVPNQPNNDRYWRYVVTYHRKIENEDPSTHLFPWNDVPYIQIGDECSPLSRNCLMRPNAVAPPAYDFMDFQVMTTEEVLPAFSFGVENRTNGVSSEDPSYTP